MRGIRWMLLLAVLLCMLSAGALATVTVSLVHVPSGTVLNSRRCQEYVTFFVPAGWKPEDVALQLTGVDSISYAEHTYADGGSIAGFPLNEHCRCACGKETLKLCIMKSENVTSVFFTTESGSLNAIHKKKKNRESGTLRAFSGTGEVLYDGALTQVKCRGNASFAFDKKSYNLKLAEKAELIPGTQKEKKWILVSNYRDKSLLRNRITMDMARAAGITCTPDCVPADVYANGDYLGSYLLCEEIGIGKGRVEIEDLEKKMDALNPPGLSQPKTSGRKQYAEGAWKGVALSEPEDITGGYLFEYEAYNSRYADETSAYATEDGAVIVVKSPEECGPNEMEYVSWLIQCFENAITAKNGIDPKSGLHYSEIADVDSLVRRYLIEEISKNYDGNTSSQYFYKDAGADSKLTAGPCWDYDSAYAGYSRKEGSPITEPEGLSVGTAAKSEYWWPKLYGHEEFARQCAEVYRTVYAPLLSALLGEGKAEGVKSLSEYAEEIRASERMNRMIWPNRAYTSKGVRVSDSLDGNVEILRDFIAARKAYLDGIW